MKLDNNRGVKMKEIINFYKGLNTLELMIICTFIVLFVFLIIFSIVLVRKNKALINRISELEEANRIDEGEPLVENYYQEEDISNISNIEEVNSPNNNEIFQEEKTDSDGKEIYQKNVLNDIVKQTSPVSITTSSSDPENKKENYLESVSKSLEEHKETEPIELTNYEQQQEDDAIISYQELLGSQDKLYNITDEEEDSPFIEELKSFRKSL